MKYIDFSDAKFKIPKESHQNFWDVFAAIKNYAGDVPSEVDFIFEIFTKIIHKRLQEIPHEHYSSILGPYCVGCRCSLLGPNGEFLE